jgi:hypothetical protein
MLAPNDPRIASLVDAFAIDLSNLVRAAALDAASEALGQRAAFAPQGAKRSRRGPTAGAKRTPEEINATASLLLAHIKAHPAQRIETIAGALGMSTRELTLPMKRLIAAKSVKTKGRKRATEYSVK